MMESDPMVVRAVMERRLAEVEARRVAGRARQTQAPRRAPAPARARRRGRLWALVGMLAKTPMLLARGRA
jgi:hypothetical protein